MAALPLDADRPSPGPVSTYARQFLSQFGRTALSLRDVDLVRLIRILAPLSTLAAAFMLVTGSSSLVALAWAFVAPLVAALTGCVIVTHRLVRRARRIERLAAARTLTADVELLAVTERPGASAEVVLSATGWVMRTLDQDANVVEEDTFSSTDQVNLTVLPESVPHLQAALERGEPGTLHSYTNLRDESETHFKLSFPTCTYEVGPFLPVL